MANDTRLDERTHLNLAAFFRRHGIRSLQVSKGLGITNTTTISDVSMYLENTRGDTGEEYLVEFKLQRDCADIYRYIASINTRNDFELELAAETASMDVNEISRKLDEFIEIIRERVKSAIKEQEVQSIRYVGNTFILNNSTVFKVLSDEGEGRLSIEILSKDKPMDAKLTASGLLDGLYLGSIKLIENQNGLTG